MNLKRDLIILKCRTHIFLRHLTEKVLLKLSEWGWIHCHKANVTNCIDDGVVHTAPDLKSNRYVFSVSYILRKIESTYEYWFQTHRGKRIFTVDESHHVEHRVSYRVELKSFYAHFSPKQRMWIHKNAPVVYVHTEMVDFSKPQQDPFAPVGFKTHRCDFSQCRYAFDFCYAPDLNTHGMPPEVLSESYKALENQLTSKVSEINKVLTGADYDGEMMSPDKTPLCENLLCKRCGLPVFASAKDKYSFMCLKHGELDYHSVDRVDPILYRTVVENTLDVLEDLIHNFATTECPQD